MPNDFPNDYKEGSLRSNGGLRNNPICPRWVSTRWRRPWCVLAGYDLGRKQINGPLSLARTAFRRFISGS